METGLTSWRGSIQSSGLGHSLRRCSVSPVPVCVFKLKALRKVVVASSPSLHVCSVEVLPGEPGGVVDDEGLEQSSNHSTWYHSPGTTELFAKPQPLPCQPPAGPCRSGRATWWPLETKGPPDVSWSRVRERLMETLLASCPVSASHRVCINPSIPSRADTHITELLDHFSGLVTDADVRGQGLCATGNWLHQQPWGPRAQLET